jgi:DNA repair protein RadD
MIKQLRPYQQTALNTLRQRLKQTTHPLLVTASVGAGKSLILSELLLDMERAGYRALCLTMNSTLIEQNAETYRIQGGNPGIYCAALESKDIHQPVIFASPHSIVKGLPDIPLNLIVIDECHGVDGNNPNTMYMRILNHYGFKAQEAQRSFRIVGLTGTPYRGKGISIVGASQFFKEEVCNISTSYLIGENFLVPALFGLTHADSFDYSKLRVNNMGKFNQSEVQAVIDKNERLTAEIMREVQAVVENGRNGAFIFAATRKHCEECARALPNGQWAIITGETPHHERKEILAAAKLGAIRYLISVNCLNVGVDIPNFDVCAWLRPTESLVLYTQGIGRVLRLHPSKISSLVLDYAQNLDRHGDIDDPIINQALQPGPENEQEYIIPCYTCGTNNTVHARRCIGVIDDSRCNHYFEFKECHKCREQNDITSRHCRNCETELIDPNAKLSRLKAETFEVQLDRAKYFVTSTGLTAFYYAINAKAPIVEKFYFKSQKALNIFYAKFLRVHVTNASDYYMKMQNLSAMNEMINSPNMKTPHTLICKMNDKNEIVIVKKVFQTNSSE